MAEQDLLVEIGTEELPPKALKSLAIAFQRGVEEGLAAENLGHGVVEWFATPRRLALLVRQLVVSQPDKDIEKYGPAVNAAFGADGKPTPAALGFARSCNFDIGKLEQGEKDGVVKLLFRSQAKGRNTEELLEKIVSDSLAKLPIPKRMRWGSSKVEFVRPVHWVVMLFGDRIVPATILGKAASNVTYGHRFHAPGSIELTRPADYPVILQQTGYVIADFETRKARIRELVAAEAARLSATVALQEDLLDEVASLVEWPVALTGKFDQEFLEVPAEALISSMTSHQKCFYLTGSKGDLLPYFIAISNLQSTDPTQVIEGNERVIRPRLADADFFYQTDRKTSLDSRRERLKQIVFQQKLGTLYEKSERVAALAEFIAGQLDGSPSLCARAARLAKCDLVTKMVGEFAELQGIMGYYYALHDGEDPEVAAALNEQYMPRHAGDSLPDTTTGCILSLAEKIDTVAGLFAIGQPPTGSKDPFALRRAAIGILRILVEKRLDLNLRETIGVALRQLSFLDPSPEVGQQVFEFFLERFRFWYQERGVPVEVYQSVLALQPVSPVDFDSRILAVNHFRALPEAKALSSANKRVANILKDIAIGQQASRVSADLLREPAEKQLASVIEEKEVEVAPFFESRDYQQGLALLSTLKDPVDRFFDEVMVMDDDAALRENRLGLLSRLRALFLQVADISFLHQP